MAYLLLKKNKILKITTLVIGVATLTGASLLYAFYLMVAWGFFGQVPDREEIKKIRNISATEVFDSGGKVIGKYYVQDRSPVSIGEISPELIKTLIVVEDQRFFDHSGVDMRGVLRVLVKTILMGDRSAGGGSTISQQLAKNLYPRQDHAYLYYPINKMREIVIAQNIEEQYSKGEILELYLNTVSFGLDIYGIESAANRFFNKKASEVNWDEAAVLVGMLKATTSYNPVLNPDNALKRRDLVLMLLNNFRLLNEVEYNCYRSLPLVVNRQSDDLNLAKGYFLDKVRLKVLSILDSIGEASGKEYNLFTDGLKVYTTLDIQLQEYAEKAVNIQLRKLQGLFDKSVGESYWKKRQRLINIELAKVGGRGENNEKKWMRVYHQDSARQMEMSVEDSIKYYLKILRSGFLAASPGSGKVLAWVGGIDHQYFPYDHVMDAKRQVGSAMKPIIYGAALEHGISPCSYYKAGQETYIEEEEEWTPSNADDKYKGRYSMGGALANSVNTVSVKILQELGVDNAIVFARKLGIQSELPHVTSIVLGTPSLSMFELVNAYSVFVNGGLYVPFYFVEKITDSEGNIIFEKSHAEGRRVMSEDNAAIMTYLLQQVVEEGTGKRLKSVYGLKNDLGGKTGTTQKNGDGWFVGISPDLVAGVWVGGAYPEITMEVPSFGAASSTALPVFGEFMASIKKDQNYNELFMRRFRPLTREQEALVDCKPFKDSFNLFEWLFGKKKTGIDTTSIKKDRERPKNERRLFRRKRMK